MPKYIGIHPATSSNHTRKIKELSSKLGLDKIEHIVYDVYKVGSKRGDDDRERRVMTGTPALIGDGNDVWLYFEAGTWYKTSPIVSCIKSDNGFLVETRNSVYELVKY